MGASGCAQIGVQAKTDVLGGVDTRWGVPVLAALIALVIGAPSTNLGFFYIAFMEYFNVTRELASWPGSVQYPAYDTAGFGSGLALVSLSVILSTYFESYRGLANGLKYVGLCLSGIVFPLLLSLLRKQLGFQGVLLVSSAIAMPSTVLVALIRKPDWLKAKSDRAECNRAEITLGEDVEDSDHHAPYTSNQQYPRNARERFCRSLSLFKKPMFYAIMLHCCWTDYSFSVTLTTMTDYIMDKGSSRETGESLIMYMSLSQAAGHLLLPLLADIKYLRRITLVMTSSFFLSLFSFILPGVTIEALSVAVSSLITLFYGCAFTMEGVLMADYLGIEHMSGCFGLSGLLILPSVFINPLLIGIFRDQHGTYDNLFRLYGGIHLFVGIIFFFIVLTERRRHESLNITLKP